MTTPKKHIVRVVIAGEEFSLRSDATAEHAQEVARYLDDAIRRVMSSAPAVDSRKAAILAALQITDELLRARLRSEDLAATMNALSNEVRRFLPPTKRLTPTGVTPVQGVTPVHGVTPVQGVTPPQGVTPVRD